MCESITEWWWCLAFLPSLNYKAILECGPGWGSWICVRISLGGFVFRVSNKVWNVVRFCFPSISPLPLDKDEASLMAKEKEAFKAGPSPCELVELSTQGGTSSFVFWFLLEGGQKLIIFLWNSLLCVVIATYFSFVLYELISQCLSFLPENSVFLITRLVWFVPNQATVLITPALCSNSLCKALTYFGTWK